MKLSEYENNKFENYKQFSNSGDFTKALLIIKELVKNNPDDAFLHAFLADTFWRLGDLVHAEEEFKIATQLAPISEVFSLNLFHCLWEQNKKLEAVEEKIRFTNLNSSKEYRQLWEDFGLSK